MWKFLLAAVLAFMSIVIFFPFLLFLDSTYIFIFIVIGAFIVLWIFNNNEDVEHNTNTDNTKRSPNINTNSNSQDIKTTKNTDFVVVDRKKEAEKLVRSIDLSNTVTDIDGNVYKTVQIGNQIWMAENLRVSRYRNGDEIPIVPNNKEWRNLQTGAWCNFIKKNAYDSEYGKLYNWYAVTDYRELAPKGWHVPNDEEWQILIDFLGGIETAGGKLKESGTAHWAEPNTGATNESGFTALPARLVFGNGLYFQDNYSDWWSATASDELSALKIRLFFDDACVYQKITSKYFGITVRCLRDY